MVFRVLLEDQVLLGLREVRDCLDRAVVLEQLGQLDQRELLVPLDNRAALAA